MRSNEKNFIKRLKRQKEEALEYVVDQYLSLVKGVIYKVLAPLQQDYIVEENQEELLKLINKLDDIDREIFIMKFFIGVDSKDIAVHVGLTRAAVDNRIYRGKKKLQQQAIELELGGSYL